MRLFVGDDWAKDHHDVEVQDEKGRVLVRRRVSEGPEGLAGFHALIGEAAGSEDEPELVVIGIETDRGPWVDALLAAGYDVLAINPLQAARYRARLSLSSAKSDKADAHMLADMARTDGHQLPRAGGDSELSEAIQVIARMHKTLIWESTRFQLRAQAVLGNYFPAALQAFPDLSAPEAIDLLGKAPDPVSAAKLSLAQIKAALKRARRRDIETKAAAIQAALRSSQLTRSELINSSHGVTLRSQLRMIAVTQQEITGLATEVDAYFGQHPDADIYLSMPGMGIALSARVLAEFGDQPDKYANAKARKNYAGTSPVTRQSGTKRVVFARHVVNDRLLDALMQWAFCSLNASPGARAYYDALRSRDMSHNKARRQLANRLVGILHGCLERGQTYNEDIAWTHHLPLAA